MNRHSFIFWILFCIGKLSGQESAPVISLLTCSPGEEIYSIYGHNAIRVRNPDTGSDLVFNYGTFDFNTPGFALKFLRGKLPYVLSVASFDRFLMEYHYLKRSVKEQVIHMDSVTAIKISSFLQENYKPENRAYAYDFFFDNCATRLRDVLEHGFASELNWNADGGSGKSFRQLIKEYQDVWPWLNFGVDLIIGAKADKVMNVRQTMFIPDYLAIAVEDAQVGSVAMVESSLEILSFEMDSKKNWQYYFFHPLSLFFLLFVLEIYYLFSFISSNTLPKWITVADKVWYIVMVISASVMIFMWWGTDHQATKDNWNLLWALPMAFVYLFKPEENIFLQISLITIAFCLLISLVNSIPGIQILPQYFHPVISFVSLICCIKLYRNFGNKIIKQHV